MVRLKKIRDNPGLLVAPTAIAYTVSKSSSSGPNIIVYIICETVIA